MSLERRQNTTHCLRKKSLACAGCPAQKHIMSTCRRNFERAFCIRLPANIRKIYICRIMDRTCRWRINGGDSALSSQNINEFYNGTCGNHPESGDPCRFRAVTRRNYQCMDSMLLAGNSRRQYSGYMTKTPIERQFPQKSDPLYLFLRDRDQSIDDKNPQRHG